MLDAREIERRARLELATEDYRAEIEAAKARLRERRGRSLWARLFPFRLRIQRR